MRPDLAICSGEALRGGVLLLGQIRGQFGDDGVSEVIEGVFLCGPFHEVGDGVPGLNPVADRLFLYPIVAAGVGVLEQFLGGTAPVDPPAEVDPLFVRQGPQVSPEDETFADRWPRLGLGLDLRRPVALPEAQQTPQLGRFLARQLGQGDESIPQVVGLLRPVAGLGARVLDLARHVRVLVHLGTRFGPNWGRHQ